MRYIAILFLLVTSTAGVLVLPAAADTRYVSDQLIITLRQGKSTQHKILKTLKTGTQMEVLEEGDTYLRVRTEDGTEGYVLRQYISSKPPDTLRINELETENSQLTLQNKELQKTQKNLENQLKAVEEKYALELSDWTAKSSAIEQSLAEALSNEQILSEKYNTLVSQAENVIKITREREEFLKENNKLKAEINELRAKIKKIANLRMIKWFLAGGGVFLFGWIAGKISRKKRRNRLE
ncbi:MAG: TIGR04211 family SH3 domain-containing protein [Deltaproteobacteria bacterium]|jgi:SH3 domain protein|nr:TIGR04211 family SH3 domain-containing protein [Deltaproteobacteria bacterium]